MKGFFSSACAGFHFENFGGGGNAQCFLPGYALGIICCIRTFVSDGKAPLETQVFTTCHVWLP